MHDTPPLTQSATFPTPQFVAVKARLSSSSNRAVHVAFCGAVYGDYEILRRCEISGSSHRWPVVGSAKTDDRLVFYNVDREKAFVATGRVVGPLPPSEDDTHYRYRALVGDIRMLPLPVSKKEMAKQLPSWKWLKFTRNMTTVPKEFARQFWSLLPTEKLRASSETASKAKTMYGNDLYQRRARVALPQLIGLASQGGKIYYEDLATTLGISNPRLLNYVLGSVGQTLLALGRRWRKRIPLIQCLVINKANELPGEGVGFFIEKRRYKQLTNAERHEEVDKIHKEIWRYPTWDKVLDELMLDSPSRTAVTRIRKASRRQGGGYGDPEKNRCVERAAIRHVTRNLRGKGYRVRSRETEKLGYDLEAIRGASVLHVEVKGVAGHLVEFLITRNEFEKARCDSNYKLHVVTRALSSSPREHAHSGSDLRRLFSFEPTAYRAKPHP